MRYQSTRLGRITTVFPIVVLIALCFFTLSTQGTPDANVVARHPRQVAARRALLARAPQASGSNNGPPGTSNPTPSGGGTAGTVSSEGPTSTNSPTSTPTTSPSQTITSQSQSSATSATSSSSDSNASSSSQVSSSSSAAETSSESSTQPASSSTSSSPQTSSSSSSTRSSASTRSTSSSGIITADDADGTTLVATDIQGALPTSSSTITRSGAAGTTLKPSDSSSGGKSGFLGDSGAMAATFSIVGIVSVGLVVAAFAVIRRRRRNQEKDIFDTQYNDYSSGRDGGVDTPGVSDMSSLAANAVSHAGSHNNGYYNYRNSEVGLGLPPAAASTSNRSSVTSNHAGFGAFKEEQKAAAAAPEPRKPRLPRSGLRNEVTMSVSTDSAYSEPAIQENQSIYIASEPNHSPYYAVEREPGSVGTAH